MPAVVVMRSIALGVGGDDKEENSFSPWRHHRHQKGEADNSRHGFLYLYQPITEVANNGLTPQLTLRKQQQLLQSCQGRVPTASYNVLTHSKIGLPPPWGGPGKGLLRTSSSNSDGVAFPQPRVAGEARYPGYAPPLI